MSIAVDQTRLRRVFHTLLCADSLSPDEATAILQITQIAAGVEIDSAYAQRAVLQAIAQQICSYAGGKPGEVLPIQAPPDDERASWLRALAAQLDTQGARELAYSLVFLVSVGDLELTPAERIALEEFQHALGLNHSRATDLVVFLTNTVYGGEPMVAGV